jgi:cytidylate kinase
MYRALTYCFGQKGWLEDMEAHQAEMAAFLEHFQFDLEEREEGARYFIDGQDCTDFLRSDAVTKGVSPVAALPIVRASLKGLQQRFGQRGRAVFDGRDMGSAIFPHAEVKVYLSASPGVRAQRRYDELLAKGQAGTKTCEEVMEELLQRDKIDSQRPCAPLIVPKGAVEIDTSSLSIQQVVEKIVSLCRQRGLR